MNLSPEAKRIYDQLTNGAARLGDVRKIAAEIKKNQLLANELWDTGLFLARLLAILISDTKTISQEIVDRLDEDIQKHPLEERLQLIDWLMANQLAKRKQGIVLMESWRESPSSLQRRIFWYYQGRLRWVGQTPPPNTTVLLDLIEKHIGQEAPEVQWAMNFTAAQIGIFQVDYRVRCIEMGERIGLYKDEVVAKGCTPSYLPNWIAVQVVKLGKQV